MARPDGQLADSCVHLKSFSSNPYGLGMDKPIWLREGSLRPNGTWAVNVGASSVAVSHRYVNIPLPISVSQANH